MTVPTAAQIPSIVRHLLMLVLVVVLQWAGTDLVPFLHDQPGYGALAATLLTLLLGAVTPLTTYGAFTGKDSTGGQA